MCPIPRQIKPFEDIERLGKHRPLAPRPTYVYVDALEVHRWWLFDRAPEIGHIILVDSAAVSLNILSDLAAYVAAVELIPGCFNTGWSSAAGSLFGADHTFEGARKVALFEDRSGPVWCPIFEENFRTGRPASQIVHRLAKISRQGRIDDESAFRQLDRGLDDFSKGQGAIASERSEPGVGRARYDGTFDSDGDVAVFFGHETLSRCGSAPLPEAADGNEIARFLVKDDDRRDPAKVAEVGQEDVDTDPRGNTGVDGVAADSEHSHSGFSREIMSGCCRESAGLDRRSFRYARSRSDGCHCVILPVGLGGFLYQRSTRTGICLDDLNAIWELVAQFINMRDHQY